MNRHASKKQTLLSLNHRHKLFGHVFSGRYKALLVDGADAGYWPL